jgi:hypothetical protein
MRCVRVLIVPRRQSLRAALALGASWMMEAARGSGMSGSLPEGARVMMEP